MSEGREGGRKKRSGTFSPLLPKKRKPSLLYPLSSLVLALSPPQQDTKGVPLITRPFTQTSDSSRTSSPRTFKLLWDTFIYFFVVVEKENIEPSWPGLPPT